MQDKGMSEFMVIPGGLDDMLRRNEASIGKQETNGVKNSRATFHNVLVAL